MASYGFPLPPLDLDVVTRAEVQLGLVAFFAQRGFRTLHCFPGFSNHTHERLGRVDFVQFAARRRKGCLLAFLRSYSKGGEHTSAGFQGPEDLPVSEEDIRRWRELRCVSPTELWALCWAFADTHPQLVQKALARPTHAGCQPFALPKD